VRREEANEAIEVTSQFSLGGSGAGAAHTGGGGVVSVELETRRRAAVLRQTELRKGRDEADAEMLLTGPSRCVVVHSSLSIKAHPCRMAHGLQSHNFSSFFPFAFPFLFCN
jgi:hypothetical protein